MKKENPALYCRFMVDGRAYSGQIRGASVDIVEGDPFAGITSQIRLSYPVERVKFLPPFAPKKIWCVGRNYVGHVKELDHDIPEEPLIFLKATSAITGANDFIRIPKWAGAIHYEGELAVVIGKGGKNIPEEEVYDHVLGYTIMNDVTARALLAIGFTGFTVHVNDRRILRAMLQKMGFAAGDLDSVCVSFDKLDKIGAGGVKAELAEKGFAPEAVDALDRFLRAGDFSLEAVAAQVGDETLTADLRYVIATSGKIAAGRYGVAYAPSLVRGQGYYTGMVFEVTCPQFSGAVAGGGRYDNMVGKFIGQQVPAVGFSIGFERVCGILLEQDHQIPGAKQRLALLYLPEADFAAVLQKAETLRGRYDVTVLPQAKKLGKQFGTLEAAGYDAVAFADNDDLKLLGRKAE